MVWCLFAGVCCSLFAWIACLAVIYPVAWLLALCLKFWWWYCLVCILAELLDCVGCCDLTVLLFVGWFWICSLCFGMCLDLSLVLVVGLLGSVGLVVGFGCC